MKFSVDWLEGAPNRAPEERATAAEFQIWLGGSNATLHVVREQSDTSVHMPVYSLAEGLALDWWRLFGSREDEISLRRYRSGYAVPDIRMRFDGATFEVHAEQMSYHNPDVRFWAGQSETLSREEAEKTLGEFIATVLERLQERSILATTAALRWARVQTSMSDPEERAYCEAASALGEDPYAVTDDTAEVVEKFSKIFRGEALTEFLAGARNTDTHRLFEWISTVRKRPKYRARLDGLPELAEEAARLAPIKASERGWAHGYRRARAFRAALRLGDAERIKTYKQLAKRLGNANFQAKLAVDGIRALRENDDRGVMLHLRRRDGPSAQTEQLFSFARGIGDVACFPEPDIAPVNELLHAYRQSCGRAFAAEFLAPIREVRAMWDHGRDSLTIADEFGVSERVIEHQIENEDRIEQACAA